VLGSSVKVNRCPESDTFYGPEYITRLFAIEHKDLAAARMFARAQRQARGISQTLPCKKMPQGPQRNARCGTLGYK